MLNIIFQTKVFERNGMFAIKAKTFQIEESRIIIDDLILDKLNLIKIRNPWNHWWTGQHGFTFTYKMSEKFQEIDVYPKMPIGGLMDPIQAANMQVYINEFAQRNQINVVGKEYSINSNPFGWANNVGTTLSIFMLIFNIFISGGFLSLGIGIAIYEILYRTLRDKIKSKVILKIICLIPWIIVSLIIGLYSIAIKNP